MSPKIKTYLKLFLYFGIPFATGMALWDYFDGEVFSLSGFLFQSIFFGLFMSLAIGSWHFSVMDEKGIDSSLESNQKLKQETSIISSIPKEALLEKLKSHSKSKRFKLKDGENNILLRTKANMEGWGEKIEIIFKEKTPDGQYLTIKSRPIFRFALVDYGRNVANINWIQGIIEG